MDPQSVNMFSEIAISTMAIIAIPFLMVFRLLSADWFAQASELNRSLANGTAFGLGAIAMILNPVDISGQGTLIDAREAFIVVASMLGGRWSSLVAAFYVMAFRMYLGGQGMEVALINASVVGAMGVLFSVWIQPKLNLRSMTCVTAIGASLVLVQFPILMLSGVISLQDLEWLQLATAVLIMYLIATPLIVALMLVADREIWLRARLQEQEAKTRAAHERFKAFMQNAPAMAFIRDAEGSYVYMNPQMEAWAGIAPDGWHGKTNHDIFPKEIADQFSASDQEILESGESYTRGQDLEIRGSPQRYLITKFLLGDQMDKRFIGGILLNITDQKKLEDQLFHAQKMEVTGQLTGGVAHDFNNLLTIIMGNLERASSGKASEEQVKAHFEEIAAAVKRGADLTQQLLAFSRQQVLAPTVINLNDVLASATAMLSRALSGDVTLSTKFGADLWPCLADRAQVESALLNLAINARHAMPDGGRLVVETKNVHLDDEYAAAQADVEPGDYVLLAVSDTGSGIAPELLDQIFEPFFTTKETGAGSGLGLSMVYGFVKQSGGHITVYSELDEGTTFNIYLPRTESGVLPKSTDSLVVPEDSEKDGAIIMIVEDDPDVRTLLVALLSDLGYRVKEAGSGPAALELLEHDDHFDLLVTDVILPGGMSGPDLAAALRENAPGTKVLFISGYAEQAMEDSNRLGALEHFLQKPFTKLDLANKVRLVLSEPS